MDNKTFVKAVVAFYVITCILMNGMLPVGAQSGHQLIVSGAASSGTINLTNDGSSDWAKWPGYIHKATGNGQISNYTAVGGANPATYSGSAVKYTWSDGTPTQTGTNVDTGIYTPGVGAGYSITIPADTTLRTVKVYVGGWWSKGTFTAHLSDSFTADYTDSSFYSSSTSYNAVYTVNYRAGSAGQTLTLTWTLNNNYGNQYGNVTLQAAILQTSSSQGAMNMSLLTAPASVNLTSEGSVDWAHWSGYDHKSTGGSAISNYSTVNPVGGPQAYTDGAIPCTWTDGTPTGSATNNANGVFVYSAYSYNSYPGLKITVPADATWRTVRIYVGLFHAQGKLIAHLSDNSEVDYYDTSLSNFNGTSNGEYLINYKAAYSNQTLSLTWLMQTMGTGNYIPYVSLEAATVVIAPPAPSAPTSLTATPGNTQVSLTWNTATGADTYNVKRGTSSGGPYTTIATGVSATSYTDTSVSNNTTYYYVVSGVNSTTEGPNSNEASATPIPPPSAPTLTATPGNAQVSLSWTQPSTATGYNVKRSSTQGGPYTTIVSNTSNLSYIDTGLVNGNIYYYVVSALNGSGEGNNSSEASAQPTGPPAPPTNLTATPGYAQVSLSWTGSTNATSYTVERSTVSGSGYTVLGTVASTSYTDTTAASGTTYYYVVTATNQWATSGVSNEVSAVPLAQPSGPVGINVSPGNGQLALTWPSDASAVSYTIKRSAAFGGSYAVVGTVTSASYTDTGLTNGSNYFYVVLSNYSLGASLDSPVSEGTPLAPASAAVANPTIGYDGDGLRAWKSTIGGTVYYLYDGDTPLCEMDSSGNITATNTFGIDGLASRRISGVSAYYLFDPQGNVTILLDASNTVLGSYMFDAYGLRAGSNTTTDPYSYFGGQWGYYTDSETSLQLLTHRYYDPATGRFVTRDPIGYDGGLNLYAYALENPIMGIDPSGWYSMSMYKEAQDNAAWAALDGATPQQQKEVYANVFVESDKYQEQSFNDCMFALDVVTFTTGIGETVTVAKGIYTLSKIAIRRKGIELGSKLITRRLNTLAEQATKKAVLTEKQRLALVDNPNLENAFRGTQIDTIFKEKVEEDLILRPFKLEVTPRFKFGPDVYKAGWEKWWDLTTQKSWSRHVAKYNSQFGNGTLIAWQ